MNKKYFFSSLIVISIIIIVGVLVVKNNYNIKITKKSNVEKPFSFEPNAIDAIEYFALDSETKPLAKKKVHIYSNNGTVCATSPCANNEQELITYTNEKGFIYLPETFIQKNMKLVIVGNESQEVIFGKNIKIPPVNAD